MTGKDLIEWIKENNAEEMLVISSVDDWLAVKKTNNSKRFRGKRYLC